MCQSTSNMTMLGPSPILISYIFVLFCEGVCCVAQADLGLLSSTIFPVAVAANLVLHPQRQSLGVKALVFIPVFALLQHRMDPPQGCGRRRNLIRLTQ